MTIQEAATAFGRLPKDIERQTINGIRRGLTYWRKLTIEGIRSRGVGRALWAKKATSLRPIVKRERVTKVGDDYLGGLKLRGLAALQEQGGKTQAHTIKPKLAGALAFMGRGGLFVTKKPVNHPGSRIPAMPSASVVVDKVSVYTATEVDRGVTDAILKAGLS